MLLSPACRVAPANAPTATLELPVAAANAACPIAVLLLLVVTLLSAPAPKAVFLVPVVFAVIEFTPIAVLKSPVLDARLPAPKLVLRLLMELANWIINAPPWVMFPLRSTSPLGPTDTRFWPLVAMLTVLGAEEKSPVFEFPKKLREGAVAVPACKTLGPGGPCGPVAPVSPVFPGVPGEP